MPDGSIRAVERDQAHASPLGVWQHGSGDRLFRRPDRDIHARPRHPWLRSFEQAPEASFGDLVTGHAAITPLDRLDAPEAANVLFADLEPDDPARLSLGPAVFFWLEKRRREDPPADEEVRRRWVREIGDALAIVALLQLAEPAVALRRGFAPWNARVADLVLTSSRDARAAYWSMLAQTQPLVARVAKPQLDPFGLVPHWLWICENAGGALPDHYLGIGLLGLRRLPDTEHGSELPWLTGLAYWADAQRPSRDEFRTQWLALKFLYPRTPARWRDLVAGVLSADRFRREGVAFPGWWDVDPDFR